MAPKSQHGRNANKPSQQQPQQQGKQSEKNRAPPAAKSTATPAPTQSGATVVDPSKAAGNVDELSAKLNDITTGQQTTAGTAAAAPKSLAAPAPAPITASGDMQNLFGDMPDSWASDDDEDIVGPAFTKAEVGLTDGENGGKFVSREIIDKLQNGEIVLKELPRDMMLPASENWLYPSDATQVYNVYRGSDAPRAEHMVIYDAEGNKKGSLTKSSKVFLFFNDHKVGVGALTGKPGLLVKLQWILHSQVPGFFLTIERGNGRGTVQVRVHVNSMTRAEGTFGRDVGFSMQSSAEKGGLKDLARTGLVLGDKVEEGLWETRCKLLKSMHEQATGPPPSRPQFVGISEKELADMKANSTDLKFLDDSTGLTHGDWALIALFDTADFSMFRFLHTDDGAQHAYGTLKYWLCGAIQDVARNGNFPHYRRQAAKLSQDVNSRAFRLRETVPPRHMVTKWRVTYEADEAGRQRPVSARAEQWTSFAKLTFYPDSESKALALRIGTERNRDIGVAIIQDLLDTKMGSLQAHIMPIPDDPSLYWIEIAVEGGEGSLFGSDHRLKPAVSSRVEIVIADGDNRGTKFNGTVQDDLFNRRPEIACIARVVGNKRLDEGAFPVSVEMKDDGTPCDRQNAALIELSRRVERTKGVDIANLVLRAKPTILEPEALAEELSSAPWANGDAILEKVISSWALNPKQAEAATLSTKTQSGTVLIHGPPGTGKSRALAAIGNLHAKLGHCTGIAKRQVLFTAPSNYAVDQLLSKMVQKLDLKKERIRVCRFTGDKPPKAPRSTPLAEQQASETARTDEFVGEGTTDTLWELCARMAENKKATALSAQYSFFVQRKQFIYDISRDTGHEFQQEALYFRTQKRDLAEALKKGDKARADECRKEITINEPLWTKRYFDEVDFVFVTNSSAAHETLMDYLKPSVLISDESALASVADIATPLAAFLEWIKLVVLAGDHKQIGPRNFSAGANELSIDMSQSLFSQLVENKGGEDHVMLTEQYRMKEAFSEMVNEIFYNGNLTNHESLATTSALEVTLKDFFGHLSPFWNGRLRLAVDVSGPGVSSVATGSAKSTKNEAEAADLVALVHALVNFTPSSTGGRKIKREDFLIITPYASQVTEIQRQLIARNLTGAIEGDAIECQIMTSASVQGLENKIVLLSSVKNEPGKPMNIGFTKDSKQLWVNFSRVEECMVTFSNIAAHAVSQIRGAPQMTQTKTGKMSAFAKIVGSYRDKKDIISNGHFKALIGRTEVRAADDIEIIFKQVQEAETAKADRAIMEVDQEGRRTDRRGPRETGVRPPGLGRDAPKARPNMVSAYQQEQSASEQPGAKRKRPAVVGGDTERLATPRLDEDSAMEEDNVEPDVEMDGAS
ncbi:unnamed protein product [Zymoseptoria tritici ST99CH_1E4]|uniref:AAA+ ATPase domain-containing protein n=1 Tax=Zymoseptoria tritici ST99CH_1E4 TaxID=1276532 RepID=A0A2H1GZR9_ZYMTR|nr:unnamed protein product [Zymoseptoria tritici ST99CH_1E4]